MRIVLSVIAAAIGFGTIAIAQTSAPPPIQSFAQLPMMVAPSISPDGTHLAALMPFEGKHAAVIYDLKPGGDKPVVVPFDEGHIVNVQFAKNDRVLITTEQYRKLDMGYAIDELHPWYRTVLVGLKGDNPALMLHDITAINYNYSASYVSDLAPDDSRYVYSELWVPQVHYVDSANSFLLTLFKVDVYTGQGTKTEEGSSYTREFVLDGNGQAKARLDVLNTPLEARLYLKNGNDWQMVQKYGTSAADAVSLAGLTEDGSSLVLHMNDPNSGRRSFFAKPLAGGPDKLLYADPTSDISGPLVDSWTRRVVGASMTAGNRKDVYFSSDLASVQKGIENAFSAYAVRMESWDRARKNFVVAVSAPRQPTAYFVFDRNTHEIKKISSSYPGLRSADLGRMNPYNYKARDGLEIPAFITMPVGKDNAKNLPAVVLVHGGPTAHDTLNFDWMAQFLASRGYVVLQPNFRGSSGYGHAFEAAGYGQWGLKMQDDVTDGVKKLIADGIADPKRICIAGGSYGGYAALAGAAFTPALYACAASFAGVSDLPDLAASWSADHRTSTAAMEVWKEYIGDAWTDSAKLAAVSPARHVANIRAPILLVHGLSDTRVKPEQSRNMASALRSAGKTVTFVEIKNETHFLQTEEGRTRWLTELEKFLDQNIGH